MGKISYFERNTVHYLGKIRILGNKKYRAIILPPTQAPNYCVRKLDVTKTGGLAGGENRVIIHLQLTDWPDRAAPGHAGHLVQLTQLTQVMLNTQTGTGGPQVGGPLLVHCSAGVGRTGTFICVDQMINNINNNSSPSSEIDIFHTVYQLRKQRYQAGSVSLDLRFNCGIFQGLHGADQGTGQLSGYLI